MLTLTVFSVATRCLGFIYKIYLTKIMTTTELGIYNVTLSIFMVLLTIVGSSIPLTISKITAKNKSQGQLYNTNYSVTSALIYNTFLAIFISLIAILSKPLLILLIGDSLGFSIILTLIPSIAFTAIYSQLRGYLWGLENYFAVSIVEFVEQIIKIALCIAFVASNFFSNPIIAVANAMNVSCGLSTLLGIYLYLKNSGRFKYKKGYFKEIIKSSAPLTFVRVLGSLLQPIVSIIIPFRLVSITFTRSEILAELGIIMGMSMPLLSIPSTIIGALCMVLIPKISGDNKEKLNEQINYYILFTICCIFIFIPIFVVLGEPICTLVFSNAQAGRYLSTMSWVMLPIGISQITTSILNALSEENKTFIYFIISNAIMLVFTLIFTPLIGTSILVIGIGLSATITTILNLCKIRKILGIKTNILILILEHILISLPVILLSTYTYNILSRNLGQFFSISLTAMISIISFISLLFAFNILNFSTIKKYFIKNKKQCFK